MQRHLLFALALAGCAGAPGASLRHEHSTDERALRAAETELASLLERPEVRGARIVAIDPADGRIVAAVAADREGPRPDAIATEVRAHGSVGKTFTLAAALASGALTRGDVLEGGACVVEGTTIEDHELHGPMSLEDAVAFSSNVAFTHVYERVGREALLETYRGLHLVHRVPSDARTSELAAARLAYGATLETTTLEVAVAYAAIASGGTYRAPHPAGEPATSDEVVLEPAVAAEVLALLEAAVTRDDATGARARVDGVRIAGKTGTVSSDGGTFGTFAGIVIEGAPRLVIVVGVDVEGDGYSGGTIAAPAFARIVARLAEAS